MTTDKMLSRNDNGVGYITFNNPEKHNAVSIEMWDALVTILDDFKQNNQTKFDINKTILSNNKINH